MGIRKVGVLTGGGDCSGLNAVIRAVTRAVIFGHDARVIGIERGFEGLVFNRATELTVHNTRDILTLGGTILGTTNKGNPFEWREMNPDHSISVHDYSEQALKTFRELELDCLFIIGGDGTLAIGHRLHELGVPVIGIPKTIDNDLDRTDYTFGFQTAVQVACVALDRLYTTGESHQRVMILEVMGRNSGWIALEAGISGGAHIILIPEIPYDIESVVSKIRQRADNGSPFSIIVVAEGAMAVGGNVVVQESASTRLQGVPQLGGIGFHLAEEIRKRIDLEVRCTVLGHIQRGGSPTAFDRILGTRFGSHAVQAAAEGKFGNMVCLNTPDISLVPLKELAGVVRQIPIDSQLIHCAESIGINLGRD
jgi:6-phosphofructokinase 1